MFGAFTYSAKDQIRTLPWLITGQIQIPVTYVLFKQEGTEHASHATVPLRMIACFYFLWNFILCFLNNISTLIYIFTVGLFWNPNACWKYIYSHSHKDLWFKEVVLQDTVDILKDSKIKSVPCISKRIFRIRQTFKKLWISIFYDGPLRVKDIFHQIAPRFKFFERFSY